MLPRLAWFDGEPWTRLAARLDRAAAILEHATSAFEVLSTMTPESFLEFRDRLAPASGFGSQQFREIELLLGFRERHLRRLPSGVVTRLVSLGFDAPTSSEEAGDPSARRRADEDFRSHYPPSALQVIEQRALGTSLRDIVYWLLNAEELRGDIRGTKVKGHAVDLAAEIFTDMGSVVRSRQARLASASEALEQAIWTDVSEILAHAEVVSVARLRRQPHRGSLQFFDACLTLDEALVRWRNQHVLFVERMIGARPGTGGGGLQYLRRSVGETSYLGRAFPCLWSARTILVKGG